MPAPARPVEDLRGRLIAAAKTLFIRDGFVGTSVDAIVRAAATSKREYYRHFPDREALFLVVVRELLGSNIQIDEIPPGKPEETLFDVARLTYASNLSDHSLGLYRASIAAMQWSPKLARAVYEARIRTTEPLAHYLEHCGEAYGLEFDDAFLAALRFGLLAIDGLRFHMGEPPFTERRQVALAEQAVGTFLNGHVTPAFRARPEPIRACLSGIVVPAPARKETEEPADRSITRLDAAAWDALHDEAWTEFVRRGYAGAGLGAVTRATKIARTTIRRRYASKEVLFDTLAAGVIDRAFRIDASVDWGTGTIEAGLHGLCRRILDGFLEPDILNLHRILLVERGNSPQRTRAIYARFQESALALLLPPLRALAKAGVIGGSGLQQTCWRLYVLTTFGGRFLFRPPTSRRERDTLTREAVTLFLYGCRRP